MRKIILSILTLASLGASAQTPARITDINTGGDSFGYVTRLRVMDNSLYFFGSHGNTQDLFSYDGNSITNHNLDFTDSVYSFSGNTGITGKTEIKHNSDLYFSAMPINQVPIAYKYNGTTVEALTTPSYLPSISNSPMNYFVHNNKFWFIATDTACGSSSGAGTFHSYDGSSVSKFAKVTCTSVVVEYNSEFYFSGTDNRVVPNTIYSELYKLDNNDAISLAYDINPTYDSSPFNLIVFNSKLYFTASNGTHGSELYEYDGTTAQRITDINISGNSFSSDNLFSIFNGDLYFLAYNGTKKDLYKYDGTTLTNLTSTITFTNLVSYRNINNKTFFQTYSSNPAAHELYMYDGSTATQVNTGSATLTSLTEIEVSGSYLYFTCNDATNGTELWRTDGLNASIVADINPGAGSSSISALTNMNNVLYFIADDGTNGKELWKLSNSVGVNELSQKISVLASPNPTKAIITFSTTEQISSIEIYNLTGQKVATFNNTDTIDISNLPKGIYAAYINTKNGSTTKKLIKE